jgi:hypothetical protein
MRWPGNRAIFRAGITRVSHRAIWSAARLRRGVPTVDVFYEDEHSSRVYVTGAGAIEPRFGYVVTSHSVLLDRSIEPNFAYDTPSWRVGLPIPRPVRRAMKSSEDLDQHEAIISLRHFWEWNYYHFYIDVLGKLELFDAIGLGRDVPIALGWYPHQLPWVREILETGPLAERTWLIPDVDDDTSILRGKHIYFCRTRRPYGQRIAHLRRLLEAPEAPPDARDMVFLTRRRPVGRTLANDAEVEACLNGLGFRTVDSRGLSTREQMEIFARVRYLVAVHGAGITNIIFRAGQPLSVLDLHSHRYPGPGDMARICRELGYSYAQLGGPGVSPDEDHADFTIDLAGLERAVETMLAH